jgi:ribosome modulation factor
MDNPWDEGERAYNEGKFIENNPYTVDTNEYLDWLGGWYHAEAEAEKEDGDE